jgi:tRNA pseudouridine13 synthase
MSYHYKKYNPFLEIPLYEFTGEGEHLVLHVRKKDMTTWEMLDAISNHVGIHRRDMGCTFFC